MKRNKIKEDFLRQLHPGILVSDQNQVNKFSNNIAFSFQYFDNSQEPSIDFSDLTNEQLNKIVEKFKHYSRNTFDYWRNQRIGKGNNHVLEIYGEFPRNSDFFHPKNIPLDVSWARFRLESDLRLIGFIIKNELCKNLNLAKNIFYIVFIDEKHRFYKTS